MSQDYAETNAIHNFDSSNKASFLSKEDMIFFKHLIRNEELASNSDVKLAIDDVMVDVLLVRIAMLENEISELKTTQTQQATTSLSEPRFNHDARLTPDEINMLNKLF